MGLELRSRWWIVLASVLGLLVGNGPVMQFTFGTLLPSITRPAPSAPIEHNRGSAENIPDVVTKIRSRIYSDGRFFNFSP